MTGCGGDGENDRASRGGMVTKGTNIKKNEIKKDEDEDN